MGFFAKFLGGVVLFGAAVALMLATAGATLPVHP